MVAAPGISCFMLATAAATARRDLPGTRTETQHLGRHGTLHSVETVARDIASLATTCRWACCGLGETGAVLCACPPTSGSAMTCLPVPLL